MFQTPLVSLAPKALRHGKPKGFIHTTTWEILHSCSTLMSYAILSLLLQRFTIQRVVTKQLKLFCGKSFSQLTRYAAGLANA